LRASAWAFKQLWILKRVQRFESIAAAEPDLTVAEAALRAGYEDPLYFSRQYKKVRKKTPSSYIRTVRKQKK
jgi:AraC-like DNA-binding protein